MTLKNPSQWIAPSGQGFLNPSDSGPITTLSGSSLTTLSLSTLIVDAEIYSPKYPAAWTLETKNDSQWVPGDVVNQGFLNFATNLGDLLVTNSGDQIVTNETYSTGKNLDLWADTGL